MTAAETAPTTTPLSRWILPLGVTAVVATAYIVYAVWQWLTFQTSSWDLSIFSQLMSRYASFEVPIVTVKGDGFNLWGDHFHPLLALLTPIYWLAPHAFTLLVIQALCFAAAAGMMVNVASRHLHSRVAGTLLALAFGFSWGLQSAAEVQFHEIALAIPLLVGALGAMLDERWRAAALWAAPLVFVKEDLGLTVAMIGVLIAVLGRKPLGIWLAVWGVVWLIVAMFIVLPAFNSSGSYAYTGNANVLESLMNPGSLFNVSKFQTIALLLVVTGGLILRAPLALVLLPTLAWRFLSPNHGYWGPTWHYSAVLMPMAFLALVDAMNRPSRWRWLRRYAKHGVAISVTAVVVMMPTLPLWDMLKPGAWDRTSRHEAAQEILDAVPKGASVETDIGLMSYLVDDHDVYWVGNDNPPPDCLLVTGGTPTEWGDVLGVAKALHPTTAYVVLKRLDGYELACRP